MEIIKKENLIDKKYTLSMYKDIDINVADDEYMIISNNKRVLEKFENVIWVDGEFIDVLNTSKKFVEKRHKIISYPLAASIRMIYSPVRSILISTKAYSLDELSIEVIEKGIEKYNITMGKRQVDRKNISGYELIDYDLIVSAIRENDFIKNII
ncbi:MAG: GrdX family protein [Peptostreptococcus sp.]|uniref:GrdX family protein n=1 Tax=Peptostreptococcus sp. TaxID=1262 RepID=UPI002FCA85B4